MYMKIIVTMLVGSLVLINQALAASINGETLANEVLIKDTMPAVYSAVVTKSSSNECNDFTVINTEILQPLYNLREENNRFVAGEWMEMWTVKVCEHKYEVPIKFMLDKTGATYAISPHDIMVK